MSCMWNTRVENMTSGVQKDNLSMKFRNGIELCSGWKIAPLGIRMMNESVHDD